MRCVWGLAGAVLGGAVVKKIWLAKFQEQKSELEAASGESELLYKWLCASQSCAGISEYFKSNGYKRVAVFGMNREGRLLADALGERAVYGIELDNLSAVHERMTVYRLGDDPLPETDCVVICDRERVSEKKKLLQSYFSGPILTLPEVLEWMQNRSM